MTEVQGPAWARGFPIDELRAVAAIYREADAPYALGAFSRVKENAVAEWRERGELLHIAADAQAGPGWVHDCACRQVQVRRPGWVHDFTGAQVAVLPVNALVIRHAAAVESEGWATLRARLASTEAHRRGVLWLEGWVESPSVQWLAHSLGLELVATKIKASSELVGVWAPPGTAHQRVSTADQVTLGHLPLELGASYVQPAALEVADVAGWADHYSSYNVRHSWSALSLRGYMLDDNPDDVMWAEPDQIVKPAEMSRQWKAEHPGWEDAPLGWSRLRQALPRVAELVDQLCIGLGGVNFQRVRLMRLQPGGGELTRHSDITDPEAGTALGKLARIHVPLITNPDVRFRQWRLDGSQVEAHMGAGEVWYLDTRKPHKAGNYGTLERIHLVADAYVNERLQALIAGATEAQSVLLAPALAGQP